VKLFVIAISMVALTSTLIASDSFAGRTDAAAREPVIAAIGDSYLAGIGAGSYHSVDGCRRSHRSAPALLARSLNVSLRDLTCPGATIISSSRRAESIPPEAQLVIVQAGGNDIGFAHLAGACFLAGTSTCLSTIASGHRRLPDVRRGVLAVVRQIRLKAPNAKVIVLGYPRILGSPDQCRHLIDSQRVVAVNRLQRALDQVIRSAARTGGATFTDWPRSVDRASLCSSDPWYAMPGSRLDDLLHPDARAARALSRQLEAVARR
jgi:lysophospholipase L1-like esterase